MIPSKTLFTKDSTLEWFAVGDYKKRPNVVGGCETAKPKDVPAQIKKVLEDYNAKQDVTVNDIIAFHAGFEKIHPFQDKLAAYFKFSLLFSIACGIMSFTCSDKGLFFLLKFKEVHVMDSIRYVAVYARQSIDKKHGLLTTTTIASKTDGGRPEKRLSVFSTERSTGRNRLYQLMKKFKQ